MRLGFLFAAINAIIRDSMSKNQTRKPLEIKISTVVAVAALLGDTDPAKVSAALSQVTGGTPDYFEDEFTVIDLGNLLAPPAPGFAVRDVRLFDGERVVEAATVVVRQGRVVAAGAGVAAPADLPAIDGRGRTLLPGLIDAHVHTWGDALAETLNFGVTTVLDMFSDPGPHRELRRTREALSPRHVPSVILQVDAVPRTLSGKKMELPVKKLLMGAAPESVFKRDAMANAGCVDWFADYARRREAGTA